MRRVEHQLFEQHGLFRSSFTPGSLASVTHVRVPWGWHPLIRVNQKTVTIHGDFGPTRIPIKQVLEVRRVIP